MAFVFYAVLMVVSLSSVVFGLEWLSEAPPVWKPVAVASVKQATKQPVKSAAAAKAAGARDTATTAQAGATQAQASTTEAAGASADARRTAMASTKADNGAGAPNDIMAPEPGTQAAPDSAEAAPKCDVQACEAAYRSFRVSDCTWQPYEGPRRFCDKGTPPGRSTAQDAGQTTGQDSAAAPQEQTSSCDVRACSAAYFTFDPTDCTYQPSDGPRRICTKGTPPKPAQAATDPATAAANAANAANTANKTDVATADADKPKCNIEACRRAYFTFTPSDCTYQPLDGPRRLCTK